MEVLGYSTWMLVELTTRDITTLEVDGIVNAANSRLAGGGGVDGAIHRAAGSDLRKACLALGGCATGDARLTPGFALPARFIIHTVGPIYQGGNCQESELLRSCYLASLAIARDEKMVAIAFPAISTGVYGYPKAEACTIAVNSVMSWTDAYPEKVLFCCFDEETTSLYRAALNQVG